MDYTYEDISKMIDHSLLNPGLTDIELEQGCQQGLDYNCASVCIMPYYLRRCAEILRGSTVKPSTTIAFPGANGTDAYADMTMTPTPSSFKRSIKPCASSPPRRL